MATILSGISLTCFGASYAVAWALAVLKLFVQSGLRRLLEIGFVLAGFLAHTLFLGYRAFAYSATPLSSSFDWCLVAAWLLVLAYLYLSYYHPRAALSLTMLPMALGLVLAAAFADPAPFAPSQASRVWGAVHGFALLAGTLAVMVGFVAGLLYLVQSYRLKHKKPPVPGFRLPSLEWLERVNSRVIILSALLIGVGFVAGVILNFVGRESGGVLPWSDPVIWSSAVMFGWLAAAALFNMAYRPARRGRKVAYLTVVSFGFLIVVLAVFLLVDTGHRNRQEQAITTRSVSEGTRGDLPQSTQRTRRRTPNTSDYVVSPRPTREAQRPRFSLVRPSVLSPCPPWLSAFFSAPSSPGGRS